MGPQAVELVLLLFICILAFEWWKSRRLRLPPGPPRLPLIGNLHQISDDYQQDTFTEWGRKYGDLVYAKLLTTDVLIVNSNQTAQALMEKRGAKYSGRPFFTFLCELGGFSWNLAFMQNNDRWKRHRKWFQHGFQVKRRLDEYIPIQQRETRRLLVDLSEDSEAFMDHFKRFAAAIMLEIGYGHTVTSVDDDHIHMVDSAIQGMFLAGYPGSMLVDVFPALKYIPAWIPGMVWKRTAIQQRPGIDTMNLKPFRAVTQAMKAGSVKPSFATALLELEVPPDEPISPAEERELSGAVGTVYTAGTETSVSTLSTWLLAMVRRPGVYKKAQSEIDLVIGNGRLPDLADRDSLPYLEAILKETYRWGTPVPLSIVHQLTEDDVYEGYDMPRGAVVIPNLWAMARDESIYEDPDEFKPERFLNLDPIASERLDPRKYIFGHGRRICPGRFLGDSSIWLAMASITATFDIGKPRDAAGREVTPPPDFLSGFTRHPAPFGCTFRLREGRAAELVLHNSEEVA